MAWAILAAVSLVLSGISRVQAASQVWIFGGEPGSDAFHERYEKNIADLRKAFSDVYHLPQSNMHVFYGPKSAGYDGPTTRETFLAELRKAAAATRSGTDPVWVILIGHANSIPGGMMFNLPGPDASVREMAEALQEASADTPLIFIATTTASQNLVKPLAAPGRMIIAANSPKDAENETDYPLALAKALADTATDTNKDGMVSVTELFLATHSELDAMYRMGGYMVQEHAQLDGNGDGRGTTRPSAVDADPASQVGLRLDGRAARKFD